MASVTLLHMATLWCHPAVLRQKRGETSGELFFGGSVELKLVPALRGDGKWPCGGTEGD